METSIEKVAEIAQEQLDREAAKDPIVRNALLVVEDFLKTHKVMCYGGTAINNLLPVEDRFYDPERDIPDYDFFSETPQLHATKIADRLVKMGYSSVEVKPGVHLGTYKVFADYIGVADVSHLDKDIFERLWNDKITKAGIHYVPPNFLRMSVYLELSRPRGDVSRWKKVYNRLQLLNKHYPVTCPAKDIEMNEMYLKKDVKKKIETFLIKEKCILLGFNATVLNEKPDHDWMLPLDILVLPEKREETTKKLATFFQNQTNMDLRIEEFPEYAEILPAHTDISDPKTSTTLIRIYETTACHSYHKAENGLMIASIPTVLQFFLSVLYAPKHFLEGIPEQRFVCTAQELIEMANENLPRRYKLLTPITCFGKQKSLIDMRAEKSELYERVSKDKSSPEFLEYFFSYMPKSMSTTKRRKVRDMLRRTLRK